MRKTRVAILGSGSHIAKGLIVRLWRDGAALRLFTRSRDKVAEFLRLEIGSGPVDAEIHEGYADFAADRCDVIVNCVGIGTGKQFQNDYSRYFTVNEQFDNLALSHLQKNPDALYISLSSGAVYGDDFSQPADENTENRLRVNHLDKSQFYSIVRLNAEAKHRAYDRLNIADLRVFAYFSRYFDPTDGYFLSDVIDAVRCGKTLATRGVNFTRDFIHPDDLYRLAMASVATMRARGRLNGAFDARSRKPVEKREILDFFASNYGLKYTVDATGGSDSATGAKLAYYSTYAGDEQIGFRPKFSAMDAIVQESEAILQKRGP